jgi:DNA-binding HxlR family transcriptional regulator
MMLAQSLKEMEADGLILRKQYNQVPPRVEYTLTDDGRALYNALHALAHWGIDHMGARKAGTPYCDECREMDHLTLCPSIHDKKHSLPA